MPLANLHSVPFGKDQVSIAVSHSGMGSGHLGIAFHTVKEGPKVLHLAWHKDLRLDCVSPDLKQCWGAETLSVPPVASKAVVAIVRGVASKFASVNYGLNFIAAKGSFSANGVYKAPKGSDGLTCASYVVEVLRAASINLLALDTWEKTVQNETWGNEVCDLLQRDPKNADHVEAVKKNINGLRVRPFEVVAAARIGREHWPCSFPIASNEAEVVKAELFGICPVPVQPNLVQT